MPFQVPLISMKYLYMALLMCGYLVEEAISDTQEGLKLGVHGYIEEQALNYRRSVEVNDEYCLESTTENSSSSIMTKCTSPWVYCDNGTCQCSTETLHGIIQCSLSRNLTILSCYCITFDEKEDRAEVGSCVYNCGNPHNIHLIDGQYSTVPNKLAELDGYVCGKLFNRTGTLCGKCKDDHYPLAYSFDMNCVKCPNATSNWWKFLLAAFLPLTLFYFIIIFFKISITTSSNLYGIAIYSQSICVPVMSRVALITTMNTPAIQTAVRFVGAVYGIWNLDFLRSFNLGICLGTNTLQTMSLDLAIGIYPILLMVLSYVLIELHDRNFKPLVVMWRPFGIIFSMFRQNWDIRTSLIDAFATFFFLSNSKLLSASFDLLAPVKIHQLSSTGELTYSWRLFYNTSVPYFGETHLPYAIIAIISLVLLKILPVLLFMFYPFRWFQGFLNLFPFRWYMLHTFMDTFQGCYKDGTEPGTRDCRWFASIFFLTQIICLLIAAYTLNELFFIIQSFILVILAIMLVIVQPFKLAVKHYAYINATFTLLLAVAYISISGNTISIKNGPGIAGLSPVFFFILGTLTTIIPFVYISAIILHWLYTRRKFGFKLVKKLRALRRGYKELQ